MIIERDSFTYLNKLFDKRTQNNVLVIEGARQVGKTTLINQAIVGRKNVISINLEQNKILTSKIDQTESFEKFQNLLRDECGFDHKTESILFIDEAQESESLGSYVRFMKEQWPKVQSVLTGSSMTRLFRAEQRIPVGRYTVLQVYPLSFLEFLTACKKHSLRETIVSVEPDKPVTPSVHELLLKQIDDYIKVGGLPAVVLDHAAGEDFEITRQSILLSQQEDFVRKSGITQQSLFVLALKGVALHLGFSANYTHISSKYNEARAIADALRNWHLVHEIEQHGLSSTTQFHPKRYLYDLGIAQDLRNMPWPSLSLSNTTSPALRTQLGGIFENAALLNLLPFKMGSLKLAGWRQSSKNDIEVDFIWLKDKPMPIECKAAKKLGKHHFSGLRQYMREAGVQIGFIISVAPYSRWKFEEGEIHNFPLYMATPENILRVIN